MTMDISDKAVSGRRGFLGAAAAAPVAWHGLGGAGEAIAQPATPDAAMQVTLTVNGRERSVPSAWLGESLLFVLRERLGLPGSKNACDQGECGSCSVTLDGVLVCACCVLAADAVDGDIRTVEGMAAEGELSDVQQAFLDAGAVQKLAKEGKSLLPIGVSAVRGEFGRGALVSCVAEDGREIARGLTNYTASEVKRIMRHSSSEIEAILGYVEGPELVHRDNLVLL